jgi:hypothetical protein
MNVFTELDKISKVFSDFLSFSMLENIQECDTYVKDIARSVTVIVIASLSKYRNYALKLKLIPRKLSKGLKQFIKVYYINVQ